MITVSKSLRKMQEEVAETNKEKGWYDDGRTFGDSMALIHSEVSEALEAFRERGLVAWWTHKDTDLIGKPEGVGSEFADILIRLLDCCERYGINLYDHYEAKAAYNRTRPYRHGGKRL